LVIIYPLAAVPIRTGYFKSDYGLGSVTIHSPFLIHHVTADRRQGILCSEYANEPKGIAMWDNMELVRTYVNEAEAQADLARLVAAGMEAVVATDNCGGMRPHFDLQMGVRLLVVTGSADDARELLGATPVAGDGPWSCAACGSPGDPGYDACWKCGHPRN